MILNNVSASMLGEDQRFCGAAGREQQPYGGYSTFFLIGAERGCCECPAARASECA